MNRQVPEVTRGWLATWCEQHLGSPASDELFRAGHLATVIGIRLADGRQVVVRVRRSAPRVAACMEVQRRLFLAGYPCPEPIAGPTVIGAWTITAESYVSGKAVWPASGRLARPFAEQLARLVSLTPPVTEVASLEPVPPWTAWNHEEGGLWPWPDDLDIDLNAASGPHWIDDAGRAARQRLQAGQDKVVIGHGDWWPGNLRWHGNRLLVAYDWDSLIADSEAVIAGLAAAVYPATDDGRAATVAETEAFLAAYTQARGRPFSPDELHRCWAAGVWTRAYEAKKQQASGKSVRALTPAETRDRVRRAGIA
jgi:hypothetical protein